MRQRVTYLLPQGFGLEATDIQIGKTDLQFAGSTHAAQERRFTLGLSELPPELQTFLEGFHELHVRTASSQPYGVFAPAVSRVPPGLHAFFTPGKGALGSNLCTYLRRFLGPEIRCNGKLDFFSKPPILSERFASAATYQFYHSETDVSGASSRWHDHLCGKLSARSKSRVLCDVLSATADAVYVDYDFDAISHALTITLLLTPYGAQYGNVGVTKVNSEDRLEVGVLVRETADEPEELSFGGYLTVVGEDGHPGRTLFSFAARHHPLPPSAKTAYSVNFQQPTGLHPKLEITLPRRQVKPPKDSCALHAYWTLPSVLFIDRYQLDDPLFLASQNLKSLRSLSGEQDLEAPNWAVKQWGSAALLELAHPAPGTDPSGNWTITIPTHLRYINASAAGGDTADVSIPWPILFWACDAQEGLSFVNSPFDRVNLGYDGLFGPKTMFYHIPPETPGRLVETLTVPTIDVKNSQWVSVGTAAAVLLGFGWICWQLLRGRGSGVTKAEEKTKKASKRWQLT